MSDPSDTTRTKDDPGLAEPAEAGEPTEADYWAASDWAETTEINPDAPGVLRGEAAAAAGRALIASAREGRPSLTPGAPVGQHARIRNVRFDDALDHQLEQHVAALTAAGQKTTPSEIIRTALANYLNQHAA